MTATSRVYNQTPSKPTSTRFGELEYIFVRPDGRYAGVVFADVYGFERTLHTYTEQLVLERGREAHASPERHVL
jgi:hypothetical protein